MARTKRKSFLPRDNFVALRSFTLNRELTPGDPVDKSALSDYRIQQLLDHRKIDISEDSPRVFAKKLADFHGTTEKETQTNLLMRFNDGELIGGYFEQPKADNAEEREEIDVPLEQVSHEQILAWALASDLGYGDSDLELLSSEELTDLLHACAPVDDPLAQDKTPGDVDTDAKEKPPVALSQDEKPAEGTDEKVDEKIEADGKELQEIKSSDVGNLSDLIKDDAPAKYTIRHKSKGQWFVRDGETDVAGPFTKEDAAAEAEKLNAGA